VTGGSGSRPDSAGSPPAAAPPLAVLVITTTVPTEADATRLADTLVTEGLAACVQIQGPVRSVFRWQETVDHATEWYVHCKTTALRTPDLMARLRALHPYEVPEIIATPVVDGHPPYLRWVEDSVRPKT
jgi:periplasmic divalent cation tolerance protein